MAECVAYDADFEKNDTEDINSYAVRVRYPDDVIMPEITETKEYYQLGLELKRIVLKRIKK